MPIYEFESPEGTKYYGEGASPQEAFGTAQERSPAELAAMRTRQSVRHGAPEPQIEIPEAAQAVKRGEYGPLIEAAGESVGELASTVMPGLSAIGGAIAPTATAESMFAAEPDAAKRRALERQYREANPRGQREILKLFNEQQGKVAEERRAIEREAAERGETQKRRADWLQENAEAIKSLKPQWQQQIQAAGSLPEAQEMFNRGMEERRKAGMTLAEKMPGLVSGFEGAAMVGAGFIPGRFAHGRTKAIEAATDEAKTAFEKAYGTKRGEFPKGKTTSERLMTDAEIAERILKKTRGRALPLGLERFDPSEIGLGTLAPAGAGALPNLFDVVMGQFDDDPAAKEKVKRAWDNIWNKDVITRSLVEGLIASGLGTFVGGGVKNYGLATDRAEGVLETFEKQRAKAATPAAKPAVQKRPKSSPALAESLRASEPTAVLQPGGADNPLSDISHPFYGN